MNLSCNIFQPREPGSKRKSEQKNTRSRKKQKLNPKFKMSFSIFYRESEIFNKMVRFEKEQNFIQKWIIIHLLSWKSKSIRISIPPVLTHKDMVKFSLVILHFPPFLLQKFFWTKTVNVGEI